MAVDSWDPAAGKTLGAAEIERLLAAARHLDDADFGLSAAEVAAFAPLARHEGSIDWTAAVAGCSSAQIEALMRLLTLAEARFPAWESGARSPVVVLARELKSRGGYPPDLNAWIKANTSNKFLPYGSLMDRL